MLKIPCICDCDKNIFRLHLASQQWNFPIETRRNRQILSNVLVIINIQQIAVCCEATIVCPNVYIACDRWGGSAVPPAWARDEPANVCRQCGHHCCWPCEAARPSWRTISQHNTDWGRLHQSKPLILRGSIMGFGIPVIQICWVAVEVWGLIICYWIVTLLSSAHTLWPSGFWVGIRYVTRCG